jgi:arsenate reductase
VTPPAVERQHWPLPDPAKVQGTEADKLQVFRAVRDEIQGRVKNLIRR